MFTADDVRALTEFPAEGYLLTSVYFHSPKVQTRSMKKAHIALKDLFREAHNRMDHKRLTRQQTESLEQDSERMMRYLQDPEAGSGARDYALFACSARDFFKPLPLPRSPETSVFVGETFCVRPLVAVLDAYPRHCVVVVDREKAAIYELALDEVQNRTSIEDEVPSYVREAGWGGYEERRIERHVDEEIHRHYQRVIGELANYYKRYRFARLLLAGNKETVAEFEAELPEELKRRVIGKFVMDPHGASPGQVRKRALQEVREFDRTEKGRLVGEVLDNAGPLGRAVVGLDTTLAALLRREVQVLLIGESFSAGGKRCRNCGFLGGVMFSDCPQCGKPVQAVDVVGEAIRCAVQEGAQVRFIADHDAFQRAGNIGAILRYRSERKAS